MNTTPNFRALCAELVVTWDAKSDLGFSDFRDKLSDIVARARSAGPWIVLNVAPPPEPPTDEEIEQFLESIRIPWILEQISRATPPGPDFDVVIVRAALERWGHPATPPPKPDITPKPQPTGGRQIGPFF